MSICLIRTLINLLAGLAVASAILAVTTMWRLLHDPMGLAATSLGNQLLPIVHVIGHAIVELARRL